MNLSRRGLVLAGALVAIATCLSLEWLVTSTTAVAATALPGRPHPSPTPRPTATPTPTPRPTPAPTPTPPPTPPPTPSPTPPPTPEPTLPPTPEPTPSPTAPPTTLPTATPSAVALAAPPAVAANDQIGSSLSFTGPPSTNGLGQAVAIAPTARSAGAVEASVPSDTENLLWVMMLAVLAIPGFVLMALIATVLIRR